MLACDIVIASDTAKFGTPEVNVGLFPMMIGSLIFRNVLKKKAMEMALLGEKLTAPQALEMGMVTRVVPQSQLDDDKLITANCGGFLGDRFSAARNLVRGEPIDFPPKIT